MQRSSIHTCANGLKTLVWPRRDVPVVSVQVWVETGSMLEEPYAGSGLSHLVEHMVFKGTQEYSAAELGEAVSSLGGLWNAYTSTDRTVFHIEGPSAHWQSFLHILLQLTLHPLFPADEWERERDVIRREMDMYRDDPNDAAYRALIETLYLKHPRRLPIIGEQVLFDALSMDDMRRYHAERYVPSNMFICIAGDVEPAAVAEAVEAEMASQPWRAADVPVAPEEPRQWGPRLCRREFAQPTSSLMLAWRVPGADHPDVAPLALLSCILGDGRSAWLYKHFHDERAMVHDISTLVIPHRAGEGALVVEADVDRPRRDALRDAILEYIETLPQADFESALRRAWRQQRVRHLKMISTVQGAADMLGSFWHHSRNTASYEEWRAALARVTPADVQRVARTWLCADRLTEVSVDPLGSNPAPCETEAGAVKRPQVSIVLPGGMRCVMRVDKRLPMLHATLAVAAGCRAEQAEQAGLCSLVAECMPKGTLSRTGAEIAAQVEDMGGALNCQAGNNTILLTLRCLAEDAPGMLELLADVALHPAFPEEVVQTAREDMLTDICEEEQDPVSLAFRHLRQRCFGSVSYGHVPGGTRESVAGLGRQDALEMHRRLMCGGNVVLAVVGDFEPKAMEQMLRHAFADMPSGLPAPMAATPPQMPGEVTLTGPCNKEQAVLAMALPGLPLHHEDYPLLLLFDEWCQDMSGPIFTEIREKRGLAYHASSGLLMGVDAGCLTFGLETAAHQVQEARCALDEVIARLAEEGMSPEALERARATALSARLLASQSISKICSNDAIDTLLGLGADYMERTVEALSRVQHEQMQSFIRRILSPDAVRTCVTLLPSATR